MSCLYCPVWILILKWMLGCVHVPGYWSQVRGFLPRPRISLLPLLFKSMKHVSVPTARPPRPQLCPTCLWPQQSGSTAEEIAANTHMGTAAAGGMMLNNEGSLPSTPDRPVSTSIRHRSNAKASGRCLMDVDARVFSLSGHVNLFLTKFS